MERYAALLRGINVGGRNKISMPELKAAFEKEGYTDVTTYINSGNIIFSSESGDEGEHQTRCEQMIRNQFKLDIPVVVLSAEDLCAALQNAPTWWGQDSQSKHNAIFVIPPADPEEVMAQVGAIKPEYERIACYGRVIFWSASLKTFSRTSWSRLVDKSAYDSVTIRNANTAKKLLVQLLAFRHSI